MKIGRNDPCPCGSGKKYKKCCLNKETNPYGNSPYKGPPVLVGRDRYVNPEYIDFVYLRELDYNGDWEAFNRLSACPFLKADSNTIEDIIRCLKKFEWKHGVNLVDHLPPNILEKLKQEKKEKNRLESIVENFSELEKPSEAEQIEYVCANLILDVNTFNLKAYRKLEEIDYGLEDGLIEIVNCGKYDAPLSVGKGVAPNIAILALGRIGSEKAIDFLIGLLDADIDSEDLCDTIDEALIHIGTKALDALNKQVFARPVTYRNAAAGNIIFTIYERYGHDINELADIAFTILTTEEFAADLDLIDLAVFILEECDESVAITCLNEVLKVEGLSQYSCDIAGEIFEDMTGGYIDDEGDSIRLYQVDDEFDDELDDLDYDNEVVGNPLDILNAKEGMVDMLAWHVQKAMDAHGVETDNDREEFIQKVLRFEISFDNYGPETPKEEAALLSLKALDSDNDEARELAEEALRIYPDTVDAYVVLARIEDNMEKSFFYLNKGLEIGKRQLGADFFEKHKGRFWERIEARPYIRCKSAIFLILYFSGKLSKAIDHAKDIIELDRVDNLDIRRLLLTVLVQSGRYKECDDLLERYNEDTAWWHYNKALVTFLMEGDTENSRNYLLDAFECNKHVLKLILQRKPAEPCDGNQFIIGSENEAKDYFEFSYIAWLDNIDAIKWVEKIYNELI